MVLPWLPLPDEPLAVGLTSVLPVEGKLDVEGGDADEGGAAGLELAAAGGDVETLGPAVLAGVGLAVQEGERWRWRWRARPSCFPPRSCWP